MDITEGTDTRLAKMPKCQSKMFLSDLKQLPKMLSFVKEAVHGVGLQKKSINQVELAAEEALVNIISYAYYEAPKGRIKVSIVFFGDEKKLILEIEDQGIPYNPLKEKVSSPKDLNLQQRKVGGLGRFFILKLMDQVSYERKGDSNILRLIKFS